MSGIAAAAAGLALVGPTFLAVSDSSHSRPFAPLSDFAEACALAAAAIAALATAVELGALSHLLGGPVPFLVLAPPALGAAPWAAGELCSGPSARQEHAFAAALVTAYLVAALTEIPSGFILLRSLCTACGAALAYACTRGERA